MTGSTRARSKSLIVRCRSIRRQSQCCGTGAGPNSASGWHGTIRGRNRPRVHARGRYAAPASVDQPTIRRHCQPGRTAADSLPRPPARPGHDAAGGRTTNQGHIQDPVPCGFGLHRGCAFRGSGRASRRRRSCRLRPPTADPARYTRWPLTLAHAGYLPPLAVPVPASCFMFQLPASGSCIRFRFMFPVRVSGLSLQVRGSLLSWFAGCFVSDPSSGGSSSAVICSNYSSTNNSS